MSNALLSDVEARAQKRRTQTRAERWLELSTQSWQRGLDAATPGDALRWFERAHRMLPKDGMIALALAGTYLALGQPARAVPLLRDVAEQDGVAEAWTGLAMAYHLLRDAGAARQALTAALHRGVPTPAMQDLGEAIAPNGWCGLTTQGVLVTGQVPPVRVWLDDTPLAPRRGAWKLPATWREHRHLVVAGPAGPMLGSPLPIARFRAVEGFVESADGALLGWASHPADPDRLPSLILHGPGGTHSVEASQMLEHAPGGRTLARAWRFQADAAAVAALGSPVSVTCAGVNLLGSPVIPVIQTPPVWADVRGAPVSVLPRPGKLRVVIPVYGDAAATEACLDSVLAHLPAGARVIVVNDGAPDAGVVEVVTRLARQRRITLLSHPANRGFPAAANTGMAAAAGCDVVLLNSDTLVPPGALEALQVAAYAAPDIGTVTPFTNDGTILSYPDVRGGNAMPDLVETTRLAALARRANGPARVDIPVGVGFCLFIRRDCLAGTGRFRDDLFAQGYGEENDFCLRARHLGWRHVAAPGVFVAHQGAGSFGGAKAFLMVRNQAILERLHPGYAALVDAYVTADPLQPARQRMDALRWAAGRRRAGAVVYVTHQGGGGVDRVVAERAAAAQKEGLRAIVLRPHGGGLVRVETPGLPVPNLVYAMPDGMAALVRLLRADRVVRVEIHHMLGHHHALAGVAAALGAEAVSVVHDYARFCPRIALLGPEHRYCGEPDVDGCMACVADQGSLLEDDPPVPVLIERSTAELEAAQRILVPSADAAARIRRHFPRTAPVIETWEHDGLPPLTNLAAHGARRVLVAGAIGLEKGFEVLLGCVRDARARRLPLEFIVVGYTMDDERLMDAGPVFVTGEFAEADAAALIRAQGAHLAFLPSIFPETWCFALTRMWQAGLATAVFDIGAQAERVRAGGPGWVLPLGLAPRGVNDSLLRLAPATVAGLSPPRLSRRTIN